MRLNKSKYRVLLNPIDQTPKNIRAQVIETYQFAGRHQVYEMFHTHLISYDPDTEEGVVFVDANTQHPTMFKVTEGSICDEHIEEENLLDYSTGLTWALPWERQEKLGEVLWYLEECVKQLP